MNQIIRELKRQAAGHLALFGPGSTTTPISEWGWLVKWRSVSFDKRSDKNDDSDLIVAVSITGDTYSWPHFKDFVALTNMRGSSYHISARSSWKSRNGALQAGPGGGQEQMWRGISKLKMNARKRCASHSAVANYAGPITRCPPTRRKPSSSHGGVLVEPAH